jgi:hypothetical protein
MQIHVSTDTRTEARAPAIADVTAIVEAGLSRFRDRLTRVEVHLSDVNGPRGGVDRRCALEARAASLQPVAVTNEAATEAEAVRGAVNKMSRMLASTFDRLDDPRGGSSASGLPT